MIFSRDFHELLQLKHILDETEGGDNIHLYEGLVHVCMHPLYTFHIVEQCANTHLPDLLFVIFFTQPQFEVGKFYT